MSKITMEQVSNILTGLPKTIVLENAEQEKKFDDVMRFANMCVGFTSAIMSNWAAADPEETPESLFAFIETMCGITAVMSQDFESIDYKDFVNFVK